MKRTLLAEVLVQLRDDPRNTRQIAEDCGVNRGFLNSILSGRIVNPSVVRIQLLWEYYKGLNDVENTDLKNFIQYQKEVQELMDETNQKLKNIEFMYWMKK